MMILINLEKAKKIAHEKRRELRADEFAPLDDLIAKQIPGIDIDAVESQRENIRDKYASMQEQIDASVTIEEIKEALGI